MNRQQQRGLTLIELMIAVTLGLLVTLAITSIFISSRLSYQQNDDIANMQENARFALELLTRDLRLSSFFGNIADPQDITLTATAINAPAANADCGAPPPAATYLSGLYNFSQPSATLIYGEQLTGAQVDAAFNPCLTSAETRASGSSVFLTKHADPEPATTLVGGTTYIYAKGGDSWLYTYPGVPPVIGGESWEFQTHIYYIDKNAVLQRKYLSYTSGQATFVTEPLAEGIDAFHIEFGIDSNNDGTPDSFYTLAKDTVTPQGTSLINSAVTATIYVLARTPQVDLSYTDTKSYQLGQLTIPAFNDKYHRRVYSTTIAMKNLRNQIMISK